MMNRSFERLGAIGVGSGLLVLIVSIGVAGGMISTIGGTTVSDATARSLLVVVVGGGVLAVLSIAVSGYVLARAAFTRADLRTASAPAAPVAASTPDTDASADTAMSRSSADLAAIVASVPGGIIAVDGTRRIVLFNRAAEQIFGHSQDEVIGTDPRQLIPDWERQAEAAQTGQQHGAGLTAHEQGLHAPLVGVRASGEEFPIEVTIAQTDANGAQFFTAVIRGVTRRMQTQEELRQANQRLRQALDDSQKAQDLIMR